MSFKTKYPELLTYGKQKYKDLDCLVNIYTLSMVWTSSRICKKMGYTQKEMEDKKVHDIVDMDGASITQMMMNYFFGEAERSSIIKCKNGEKLYSAGEGRPFFHEREAYLAVCKISLKKLKKKNSPKKKVKLN